GLHRDAGRRRAIARRRSRAGRRRGRRRAGTWSHGAMRLYTYWRSSAAYRVRIALNLKGLAAEQVPTHLVRGGGAHREPDYLTLNPQGLVPALEHDGRIIG